MIDQELCLENEPGAGARYMKEFDHLHPVVRQRLRDSHLNICLACLDNITNRLHNSYEPPPPSLYCEVINHFEKGTIHDLRNRIPDPRRQEYGSVLQGLYGNPYRPAPNFYDSLF